MSGLGAMRLVSIVGHRCNIKGKEMAWSFAGMWLVSIVGHRCIMRGKQMAWSFVSVSIHLPNYLDISNS